jgi:hypothetical protein
MINDELLREIARNPKSLYEFEVYVGNGRVDYANLSLAEIIRRRANGGLSGREQLRFCGADYCTVDRLLSAAEQSANEEAEAAKAGAATAIK